MGPEISQICVTLFKEVSLGLKHMLIVCLRSFLDDSSLLKLHDSEIIQKHVKVNKIQACNYIQANEAVASPRSSKNKL